MVKLKKLLLVAEREYWKMMSYLNGEKYKDGYPNYLRKIGINIPADYRVGGVWVYCTRCPF